MVARLVRDQEVVGSNPVASTKNGCFYTKNRVKMPIFHYQTVVQPLKNGGNLGEITINLIFYLLSEGRRWINRDRRSSVPLPNVQRTRRGRVRRHPTRRNACRTSFANRIAYGLAIPRLSDVG